jgi:hypothetical protein
MFPDGAKTREFSRHSCATFMPGPAGFVVAITKKISDEQIFAVQFVSAFSDIEEVINLRNLHQGRTKLSAWMAGHQPMSASCSSKERWAVKTLVT